MADLEVLRERIAKFADRVDVCPGGLRRLSVEGGVTTALIREIEETQLPRQLSFDGGGEGNLVVHVAGGRVLAMESGDTEGSARLAQLPRRLEDVEPSHLRMLARRFQAFLQGARFLELRVTRGINGLAGHPVGLSPAKLFQALEAYETHPVNGPPLKEFANRCGALVSALVVLARGEFEECSGEPCHVDWLKKQALSEWEEANAQSPYNAQSSSVVECVIYSGHPDTDLSVFCAAQDERFLLAVFEKTSLRGLLRLWDTCRA